MNGIEIAALITSLVALAAWGGLLWQLTDIRDRKVVVILLLAALPLSPAAYYGVRLPLIAWLQELLGNNSAFYQALRLFYAPLIEEPAKLLPLVLLPFLQPRVIPRITKTNTAPIAMALGLGFGIGEIWLIANMIRFNPKFVELPFYQFGGFLQERLIVCLTHAGFTVLAVWGLRGGWRWFPLGLLAAMTAHFLGNFPIALKNWNVGGLGEQTWNVLIVLWLVAYLIGTLILLCALRYDWSEMRRVIFGKARCPSCDQVYARPIFGLNAAMYRYEQCPLCRRWHWIDGRNNLPPETPSGPAPTAKDVENPAADQCNGVSADSK